MVTLFPNTVRHDSRGMVFVDGENLAIRYGEMLKEKGGIPFLHVRYEPDVYVWSQGLNNACTRIEVIRKHYYTSVQGASERVQEVQDQLKGLGIEAPFVFRRTKTRGSKRVDISLTTDMLTHAARRNYDIAVLVAGDEDYVPLVEAVKLEGRRVFLWFVENGLSDALRRSIDHYADIGRLVLFSENV